MPTKSSLPIIVISSVWGAGPRLGNPRREADRPDAQAGGGAEEDRVALVAWVGGEVMEAGPRDRERLESGAVEFDGQLPVPLERRVCRAPFVAEGELGAVLARGPRPLPVAPREDLRTRRHHP